MSDFESWLNSGRFVYLLLPNADYASSASTVDKYPDALELGDYRLLTIDRKNAAERYQLFEGVPHTFGFADSQQEPAFLTKAQAIEVKNKLTPEVMPL